MRITTGAAICALMQLVFSWESSAALINEFHYDNVGGDTDEFFEILLAPGEDISDFKILTYNGNGGGILDTIDGTEYTATVSNVEGFQIFSFDDTTFDSLQNDLEGLALVSTSGGSESVVSSGGVLQFLSYEGAFVATDGTATGLTSTNIGLSEDPAPAVGSSLALTGTGHVYSDFTWSGPAAATSGLFNPGQVVTANATAAPEPGSAVGLLALAGAVGFRRWRRAKKTASCGAAKG